MSDNKIYNTEQQKTPISQDLYESLTIEELAKLQNVKPMSDVRALFGTWPDKHTEKLDTEDTQFPVCPECGYIDTKWWDGLEGLKYDGDSWGWICPECGVDITITMCIKYSFTTNLTQ